MKKFLFFLTILLTPIICFAADANNPDDKWVFDASYQTDAGATEYRVGVLTFDICDPKILIEVYENVSKGQCSGRSFRALYTGDDAMTLIKDANTRNFSTTSMHRKLMNQLETDGKIPSGQPENN